MLGGLRTEASNGRSSGAQYRAYGGYLFSGVGCMTGALRTHRTQAVPKVNPCVVRQDGLVGLTGPVMDADLGPDMGVPRIRSPECRP